uniref:Uncharacterized protein n=1 Tax=Trypanosoma vivax (strain Y486) TaxID=1055687 RepID=G0U820_TRYVY|nr:conserved hypothetical protein, fragment [Trypanosoma vivax Y486]
MWADKWACHRLLSSRRWYFPAMDMRLVSVLPSCCTVFMRRRRWQAALGSTTCTDSRLTTCRFSCSSPDVPTAGAGKCSATAIPAPTSRKNEDERDPVCLFLRRFCVTPLTQLAQRLPDEVIEKLPSGLRSHLEKFPMRYRLSSNAQGTLFVERIDQEPKQQKIESKETSQPYTRIHSSVEPCVDVDELELFIRERLMLAGGTRLWMLTTEHKWAETSDNAAGTPTDFSSAPGAFGESSGVPSQPLRQETLVAMRWVCLSSKEEVDEALKTMRAEARKGMPPDGLAASSGSLEYSKSVLYVSHDTTDIHNALKGVTFPLTDSSLVEEYNVYRLSRALSTRTFISLPELQELVEGLLTQSLPVVLAVGGEESRSADEGRCPGSRRSIFDFEYDPRDKCRIVGVRFWLDELRFLPSLYHERTTAELQGELADVMEQRSRMKIHKLPNQKRVSIISKTRLLSRCIALHEFGTSPFCHPDVLAYYVFDLLPMDDRLVITGHLPQLLPEEIRRVTDARCRAWLRRYPHLFRLVEHPPELCVQRVDAAMWVTGSASAHREQQEEDGQEQATHCTSNPVTSSDGYQQQLLTDPEEQLRFVVSLVAARLEANKSRKLLPSHLPKFMSSELRRVITPRHSGGIEGYLKRHPDVFILTYGDHPHEPTVSLAPQLHPNPRKTTGCSSDVPNADAPTCKD